MNEKQIKLKDLYVSDDFINGLKTGKKFAPNTTRSIILEKRKPIVLDKNTWLYIEKTKIIVVHEIYEGGKYLRTDQIILPKKMLSTTSK